MREAKGIPTAQDLEEWAEALEHGYAVTEMMPRFLEGYRRLLVVAEAARPCVETYPSGHKCEGALVLIMENDYDRLSDLDDALKALDAPVERK